MPRDLPLANGNMLVNYDASYNLRDVYFPYVGSENHTNGELSRFGVWVDGQFAWIDGDWERRLVYQPDTLVTDVTATNARLGLALRFNDTVDFDRNVLVRRIQVRDLRQRTRAVRLFQHINAHLMGNNVGDTIYYDPNRRALIHYKGQRYLLLCGTVEGRNPPGGLDSFAIGTKEVNGAEGTWRDAEDGELGHNPVAQGSVDSVGALHLTVPGGGTRTAYLWLCAGFTRDDVTELNRMVIERGPQALLTRTANYWKLWCNKQEVEFCDLPQEIVDLYRRSLLVMRTQIDDRGAIIAANDADILQFGRDTYSYMWPRDGALVAYAFAEAGYREVCERFYNFCWKALERGGFLLHKYNPDGSVGSSWHPWASKDGHLEMAIQEDETALVLFSLWSHYEHFRDAEYLRPLYRPLIKAAADFLVSFRDSSTGLPAPSHDLWEERRGIHSFTVSAVWAGLCAAARFTEAFGESDVAQGYRRAADEIREAALSFLWDPDAGRFLRMVTIDSAGGLCKDMIIDSSVYGLFAFGMLDARDDRMVATMRAVEERLWCKTEEGGLARYENDYYHQVSHDVANVPGNPWFICTLWLAQWRIAQAQTEADLERAVDLLHWVRERALPSGVLAEQVHPYDGRPLSVSPLTWSHAAYVTVVHAYLRRLRELKLGGVLADTGFEVKGHTAQGAVVASV